jgi:uncharacterized protein YcfL
MKWKLLLCVALLYVVGCSSNQSAGTGYQDMEFSADLVPPPVLGLSADDADLVYSPTAASPSSVGAQSH